jgi:hypothetical protein
MQFLALTAGQDRSGGVPASTPPANGFVAFVGELDYEIDGIRHQLSTQVRVAGKN